jgi:hypothetical protein
MQTHDPTVSIDREPVESCTSRVESWWAAAWFRGQELGSDERAIEKALGPQSMELLRRFSACANKASWHPTDRRRWLDFLIHRYFQSDRPYPDNLLAKWLRDQGWRTEKIARLVFECEFARELLHELERYELLAPWLRGAYEPLAPPNKRRKSLSGRKERGRGARAYQVESVRWLRNFLRPALTTSANLRARLRRA